MRKQLLSFAIAGMFLAGSVVVFAQDHDRDRDHDRDHDWDGARGTVSRTMEDLRHVEHRDAWAVVDRGHYEAAERNLADVNKDLSENRLDRRRLNAAISEIEHVSDVTALDRHSHERLSDDIRDLRHLESSWHWR